MLESLYAVQYGKGFKYGGPDFSFLFYVAKVKGKWVLFDTGFSSQELAMAMGITMIPVKNEMKAIGMPGQIQDILITHSHWDLLMMWISTKMRVFICLRRLLIRRCQRTVRALADSYRTQKQIVVRI